MIVRSLTVRDVPGVHALGTNEPAFCFDPKNAFWTQEQLARWCCAEDGVCLGAFEGEQLIGFVLAGIHMSTMKATWENLVVLPEFRHHGTGAKLTEELFAHLKAKGVFYIAWVTDGNNDRLHQYFRSLGCTDEGLFRWFGKQL